MHTPAPDRKHLASPDEKINLRFVWFISAIAACGGLLFGYDWVVIGGAKPFYEKYFGLTTVEQQGWAMSCALVGSLVGAAVAGVASDKWGRKPLILVAAALFAISSLLTGFATTFNSFILWRIVGGGAIGLASGLSPLYIAEIAPASLRGRLVSLNQLTIVVGILLAQVVNFLIAEKIPTGMGAVEMAQSWNGQVGWRWMFGVTAIPSVVFFVGALLMPESPRWLVKAGRHSEASPILDRIGGRDWGRKELSAIEATLASHQTDFSWKELFTQKNLRVLGLGIVLAVFQQWCGINVVFNYAEEVFSAAGYGVSDILMNIVITGSVNLMFTFVALSTVDLVGRRKLMLFGAGALAVLYTLLGYGYFVHSQGIHMLVLVLLAIGCYSMSLAPVTWVVISETFPNRIRGAAMSISVGFLWIACFLLTYTFPLLNKAIGASGTFWLYAAICALGFVFLLKKLPETKGKTLEEIESS